MMMPQVMHLMILLLAHLMMMVAHAAGYESDASALQHHHIASCHKVTIRYLILMWLIMLIHMMSLSRLASMTMSLENEKAKTLKLENENSFLKNSCEEHKHLLDVLNLHMVG